MESSLNTLAILQCSNLGGMEQVAYSLLGDLNRQRKINFNVLSRRPFGDGEMILKGISPTVSDHSYEGKFGWKTQGPFKRKVNSMSKSSSSIWVIGTCASSLSAIRHLDTKKLLSHHYHHFENRLSYFRWKLFYELLCRDLTHITYPTHFTRNEAISISPWLSSKSSVVRNSIPIEICDSDEKLRLKIEARKQLSLPKDAFVIGNAGWFISRKRLDVFLETAALLYKRTPKVMFVLCGGGPLENEIKHLAKELGLEAVIRFEGWKQDLKPYYRAWDLCYFTSDFDALGMVPLEAAAHYCCVAASVKRGGLSEIIKDKENGIIFNNHNPEEMAETIHELISDESVFENYQQAIIKTLRSECCPSKSLDFYDKFFSES